MSATSHDIYQVTMIGRAPFERFGTPRGVLGGVCGWVRGGLGVFAGYLKAVWPDFLGQFLGLGRPLGALK